MLDFQVFMSRMGGGKSLIYNHLVRIHTDLLDTSGPLDGVCPRPAGLSVCADNPFIYRSVMKKVFLFASAAIAALAVVSCNKEIEIQDKPDMGCPDGYYVEELTAVYPRDPETRTAFNETTGKFAWTEGDELAFHLSNGTYTSAPIDPATSKVKLYLPVGVTRNNYAVYPASAVVDEAAEVGNMQVTLPSTYDISGNLETEFVPMPLIATNDAENKSLKFEHVGGLLQVNLDVPVGVKTATLSMGKTITGTFNLNDGTGNGVIEASEGPGSGITFILSEEGLTNNSIVKLLAPLPTGSYNVFKVSYDTGYEFEKNLSSNPWVFSRTQGKKVSIAEDSFEPEPNYFYLRALVAGTSVKLDKVGDAPVTLFYSSDKTNWISWDGSPITFENAGDIVYFYGENNRFNLDESNYNRFYCSNLAANRNSDHFSAGGDITTLLKKSGKVDNLTDYCFYMLFYGFNMNNYGNIVLPSMGLARSCYEYMFGNCAVYGSGSAPELPATVLAPRCYKGMFSHTGTPVGYNINNNGLASISRIKLRATKMEEECYAYMFAGCRDGRVAEFYPSVDLAPGCYEGMFLSNGFIGHPYPLPATELAPRCYKLMYSEASNMYSYPELPATELEEECYMRMFGTRSGYQYRWINASTNLSGVKRYYGQDCRPFAPELPATKLAPRCYEGMFACNGYLESYPELPATELADGCYKQMFFGCSNKVAASRMSNVKFGELPAAELAPECYFEMFKYSYITSGPSILPAMDLEKGTTYYKETNYPYTEHYDCAYTGMFSNCPNITLGPALPAVNVTPYAYMNMFSDSGITESPVLPATTVGKGAYYRMFYQCSSLAGHVNLPATVPAEECYHQMFVKSGIESCEIWVTNPKNPDSSYAYSYTMYGMFNSCTSLKKLQVHFTTWSTSYYPTSYWLEGTLDSEECIFIKPAALYIGRRGSSMVPANWTIMNAEEVGAGI